MLYKKNRQVEVLPLVDVCKKPGEMTFFLWAVQHRCLGQAVVTRVFASRPPYRHASFVFVAQRVQHSHCSFIFIQFFKIRALALSFPHARHEKKAHNVLFVLFLGIRRISNPGPHAQQSSRATHIYLLTCSANVLIRRNLKWRKGFIGF